MNILTLSIKQKFFDQILAGEKKNEIREIRPKTADRYCEFEKDGLLIGPKKYDALKLLTGAYVGERQWLLIEVKDAVITLFDDEETGQPLTYIENGVEYIEAEIEYQLGNIIDKSIV